MMKAVHPSSPNAKTCHICTLSFPKSIMAAHLSSCMKKKISRKSTPSSQPKQQPQLIEKKSFQSKKEFDSPTEFLFNQHWNGQKEEEDQEIERLEQQIKQLVIKEPKPETIKKEFDDRVPCSICKRKFNPDALDRHLEICEKLAKKQKRKPVDFSRVRASGTEIEKYEKQKPYKNSIGMMKQEETDRPLPTSKKSNWRQKHENLIRSLRMARGVTSGYALKEGDTFMSMEALSDDKLPCTYCGRKFNQEAAERHFSVCEQQYKRNQMKKPPPSDTRRYSSGTNKLDALKRRIGYQPPLPGKKRSISAYVQ